jgi:hypothetical protein
MLCHDFGILKRERPTMTHIQSIFDLCPDIQEQIGKELAPLVKSKKLKMDSIHQCKDLMNEYDMPNLEDYVFETGKKNHIGRMLLYLIKKKVNIDQLIRLQSEKNNSCLDIRLLTHLAPDLTQRHLNFAYYLMRFPNYICKGEELNLYGLKWKTCKDVFHEYARSDFVSVCYVNLYRRPVQKSYTSKQLDELAEPLGIKNWRKHWKKDKKIHHLMKTEV